MKENCFCFSLSPILVSNDIAWDRWEFEWDKNDVFITLWIRWWHAIIQFFLIEVHPQSFAAQERKIDDTNVPNGNRYHKPITQNEKKNQLKSN